MSDDKRIAEWEAITTADGRSAIMDNDFAHDAMLYVSGDFSDDADRRTYTEQLARKLNSIAELEAALAERTRERDEAIRRVEVLEAENRTLRNAARAEDER